MSNVIDKIRLSGTDYTLSATTSGVSVVEVTQAEYDALPSSAKTDTSKMYVITDAEAGDLTNYYTKTETNSAITQATSGKVDTTTFNTYSGSVETALSGKQDTLVSGTNIKTINNESLLGSGNIDIQGGGGGGKAIEAGRGISVASGDSAYTVSFNLPIYAGTGENSIIIGDERNITSGRNSVAEGFQTSAMTSYAHSEGSRTLASGSYSSHAEGSQTSATSEASHSEGYQTTASGKYSHSEGLGTLASGQNSHSEGKQTSATTTGAHSEGKETIASGAYSHAEGSGTTASGAYSHTEGKETIASGNSSHSEGYRTTASGAYSHAEGSGTTASGAYSHAEGSGTKAQNNYEHASGYFNVSSSGSSTLGDSGNTLFSVGNGTADNARHNAFEIRQNGDIYLTKDGQDVKLQDQLGGGGGGGKAVSGGTNISIATGATADTINCTLPIREGSNSSGKGIIVGDSECTASGLYGISLGHSSDADGAYSFCNGSNSYARGQMSFAYGNGCDATHDLTFMFGHSNVSTKSYQYSFGRKVKPKNELEFGFGTYNNSSSATTTFGHSGNTMFSIGNGYDFSSTHNWHNAFEVRQNGDIYVPNTDDTSVTGDYAYSLYPMVRLQDTITATAANTTALGGLSLVKLTQAEYDALATKDSNTLYVIVN